MFNICSTNCVIFCPCMACIFQFDGAVKTNPTPNLAHQPSGCGGQTGQLVLFQYWWLSSPTGDNNQKMTIYSKYFS